MDMETSLLCETAQHAFPVHRFILLGYFVVRLHFPQMSSVSFFSASPCFVLVLTNLLARLCFVPAAQSQCPVALLNRTTDSSPWLIHEMWQWKDRSSFLETKNWHIHVVVFWVRSPYSDVVGHYSLGGLCCLHLQGELTKNRQNYLVNVLSCEQIFFLRSDVCISVHKTRIFMWPSALLEVTLNGSFTTVSMKPSHPPHSHSQSLLRALHYSNHSLWG